MLALAATVVAHRTNKACGSVNPVTIPEDSDSTIAHQNSLDNLKMAGVSMAEDLNTATTWDSVSNAHSDINAGSPIAYVHSGPAHPDLARNGSPIHASSNDPPSPQLRSSFDSTSKWTDNISVTFERRDTLSTIPSDAASLVEPSFDENVLRALCDLDVSIDLVNTRIRSLIYVQFGSAVFRCS